MSLISCSRTPRPLGHIKAIKAHQREDFVKEIVQSISLERMATELWVLAPFTGGVGRGYIPILVEGPWRKSTDRVWNVSPAVGRPGCLTLALESFRGLRTEVRLLPRNEKEDSGRAENCLVCRAKRELLYLDGLNFQFVNVTHASSSVLCRSREKGRERKRGKGGPWNAQGLREK